MIPCFRSPFWTTRSAALPRPLVSHLIRLTHFRRFLSNTAFTGAILSAMFVADSLHIPGMSKFMALAEPRSRGSDGSVYYVKTMKDIYTIAFYAVFFTFLRCATMTYVLVPFADRWFNRRKLSRRMTKNHISDVKTPCKVIEPSLALNEKRRDSAYDGELLKADGNPLLPSENTPPSTEDTAVVMPTHAASAQTPRAPTKRPAAVQRPKKSVRFAEQGWVFVYHTFYWAVGMYLMYNSPTWYYRTKTFWEDYPHLEMGSMLKWYYMSQAGFWISQLWVVQTETKRKDHLEMVLHHLVTCALITSSYVFNFTRIGTAVFVMMYTVDIFLPLAKMLRYLGLQKACDCTFVVFVLSWIYTRHYLYYFIVKSIWLESSILGTYPPHPENPYNEPGKYAFIAGFLLLQSLMIYWFVFIIKIVYRVITGQGAGDDREREEEDEEEEEEVSANEKGKEGVTSWGENAAYLPEHEDEVDAHAKLLMNVCKPSTLENEFRRRISPSLPTKVAPLPLLSASST